MLSSETLLNFYCGGDVSGDVCCSNKTNDYICVVKIKTMAAIAGVTTKKNAKGQITHVTVDVRKHKAVIPMFNEIGIMPKTKFDELCEKGTPIEEAFDEVKSHIRSLWRK